MSRKNDLYINYERSYRKRQRFHGRRRRNNKSGLIILIVLLAAGIGVWTYYAVKLRMDLYSEDPQSDNNEDMYVKQDEGEQEIENNDLSESGQQPDSNQAEATQAFPSPTAEATTAPTKDERETSAEDTRVPVVVKGIYITASTAGSAKMNSLIELADRTEINAMVIDVKNDYGKISYQMNNQLATEIGAVTNTIPDIEALIRTLKERKIYLIARIVAFKDPILAERRSDLAIKNADGSIYLDENKEGWVNPYNKEVWDYLIEISTQAAAVGFDEIQFDYIRFSTGKGIADAYFGEEAETISKEEIIAEFTKYAYEKLKPLGVFVSADVYGTIISSKIDQGLVGQNYVEMSKYLDYICPMIYPSHYGKGNYGIENPNSEPYNIIRKALTASKDKLSEIPEGEHRAVVRPWLQDFTATWVKPYIEYGGTELREQINGVYSVGYEEWLLWNASSVYTEEGLEKE